MVAYKDLECLIYMYLVEDTLHLLLQYATAMLMSMYSLLWSVVKHV